MCLRYSAFGGLHGGSANIEDRGLECVAVPVENGCVG